MKKLEMKIKKMGKATLFAFGVSILTPAAFTAYGIHKHSTEPGGLTKDLKRLAIALDSLTTAHASAPSYSQNVINSVRAAIGAAIGYSDAGYLAFICDGDAAAFAAGTCSNGPPQSGIAGVTVPVANELKTVALNSGITDCAAVPASGTATGNDSSGTSQTITWQTPTHSIPSTWLGGGTTFQKRARMATSLTIGGQTGDIVVAMEFNCGDSAAAYMAVTMPVGSNAVGYTRNIAVFSGAVNSTTNGFDVYYTEANDTVASSSMRSGLGLKIEYVPSTSTFNLWSAFVDRLQTNAAGTGLVAHAIVSGNYSTGDASVYYNGIEQQTHNTTGNPVDIDSVDAAQPAAADEGGVGTAVAFDMTGDLTTGSTPTMADGALVKKQGCINFENQVAPTSSVLCTGFPLVDPPAAPALDSSGKFSVDWVVRTLVSKLETVE